MKDTLIDTENKEVAARKEGRRVSEMGEGD